MNGRKVAELVRKKFSWRTTFHIYSGFEFIQRRATLHLRHFEFRKKAHVYIYQPPYATRDDPTDIDNMEPDIIIKSENVNFFSLISEVKMFNGQTEEEYADISKEKAQQVLADTTMQTYLTYLYLKRSPPSRWSGLHHIVTPFSGVLDLSNVPCLSPVVLHLLS